ncbi:hypothetical protein GA0061099_102130 [Bradyrhizobium yuanmingense]|uniref:Uncharacterized protein n=2 Tax=Bradyrhizobium yuanmingense TaxID=108015 RepID=A0A1C3XHI7_9BRAD|nr:hypothetical protein IQ15_06987 [Bradyrhizobium yuanmingense]SCB51730.1 hypothetical protein GA0061099_102130 [Bradyrhizobium yuanmingense]
MNQHLPPENLKEIGTIPAGTIGARPVEHFLLIRGKHSSWVDGDVMTRAEIIKVVDEDAYEDLRAILALTDLKADEGDWRKATDEIVSIVIQRWAEDEKLLTPKQKEFVAAFKGEAFANAFRVGSAA